MVKAVGIDFGTTNSVVALLHEDGSITTRRHGRSPPTWKIRWTAG
jgi:molecular chaperone DnaK (HSP70)